MKEASVADLEAGDMWLEPVMERHLTPVAAPDELWRRVRNPAVARPRVRRWNPVVILEAVALLAALVYTPFFVYRNRTVSREALAVAALHRGAQDLELRSSTVGEIRDWVKARTGLDIPLPESAPECVRMSGACSVKGGGAMVEVAYRMNGRNAVMLVSRAPEAALPDDARHRFLKSQSIGGTRVSSWVMRGQLYTLAFAGVGDARDECRLCHDGGQAVMLVN
jgi:hypothetical protein